jgi:hypothetical protein
LLIYFPLRRTWARQFPEGSLTITGIRVHSYLKSCAICVQQGNETSIKSGKSRDKNCTRSHLFASVNKDKLLNYNDKIFAVAPMMDWTDTSMKSIA